MHIHSHLHHPHHFLCSHFKFSTHTLNNVKFFYITMWHLSWPKTTTRCTTKTGGDQSQTTTATATKCIEASSSSSSSASHCTCLTKLRKQRRRVGCSSKSSSFQCRYDPLSYSLNFDTSGCGNLLDDKDYYKFYAFSSRFVANPSGTSCSRLITTSTH